MPGRKIGEAFIEIRARGDTAIQEAERIGNAIESTPVEVPVRYKIAADEMVAQSRAMQAQLAKNPVKVPVQLDTSSLAGDLGGYDRYFAGIQKKAQEAAAAVSKAGAEIRAIQSANVQLKIETNAAEAAAEMQRIQDLSRVPLRMSVQVEGAAAAAGDLDKINANLRQLSSQRADIQVQTTGIAAASADIEKINADLRAISSQRAVINITTREDAVRQLEQIESRLRALGGSTTQLAVTLRSEALTELDDVVAKMRELDGQRVEVLLGARDELRQIVLNADNALDALDGRTAEATMAIRGTAIADLDKIEAELRDIEGRNVSVTLTARDQLSPALNRVRQSGSQTRNVLGNMIGNTVQDMGSLAGVTGTAGVALGQMAEYAADGTIGLKGMVGMIGPMVGIGAVIGIATMALQDQAKEAAANEAAIKSYFTAINEGATTSAAILDTLTAKLMETGKLDLSTLFGETENIAPMLAAAGQTVADFQAVVEGGKPALEAWGNELRASGLPLGDVTTLLNVATLEQARFAEGAKRAAEAQAIIGDEAEHSVTTIAGAANASTRLGAALNTITPESMIATAEAGERLKLAIEGIPETERLNAGFAAMGDEMERMIGLSDSWAGNREFFNAVMTLGPTIEGGAAGAAKFNSEMLGLETIASSSASALDGMADSLASTGEGFDAATEGGRANIAALSELAGSTIPQVAANYKAAGGSLEAFANSQRVANLQMRAALLDLGVNATQAEEIANRILPFDGEAVEMQFALLGTEDAAAKLAAIMPILDELGLPGPILKEIGMMFLAGASPADILAKIQEALGGKPVEVETALKPPPPFVPQALPPAVISMDWGPQPAPPEILLATVPIPTTFEQPAPPETGWTNVPAARIPVEFDMSEDPVGRLNAALSNAGLGAGVTVPVTGEPHMEGVESAIGTAITPRSVPFNSTADMGVVNQAALLAMALRTIPFNSTGDMSVAAIAANGEAAITRTIPFTSEADMSVAAGAADRAAAAREIPFTGAWQGLSGVPTSLTIPVVGRIIATTGGTTGGPVAGVSTGRTNFGGRPVTAIASGGMVPGVGNTDNTPALLTPGEFVINKKSVQRIGLENLFALNAMAAGGPVRRLASGGYIGQDRGYLRAEDDPRIPSRSRGGAGIRDYHNGIVSYRDGWMYDGRNWRFVSRFYEDQAPARHGRARLVDFNSRQGAVYADGWRLDANGWHRPGGSAGSALSRLLARTGGTARDPHNWRGIAAFLRAGGRGDYYVHLARGGKRYGAGGLVGMATGGPVPFRRTKADPLGWASIAANMVYGVTPAGGSWADPHNWRGIDILRQDSFPGTPVKEGPKGSAGTTTRSTGGGGGDFPALVVQVNIDGRRYIGDAVNVAVREATRSELAGSRHAVA